MASPQLSRICLPFPNRSESIEYVAMKKFSRISAVAMTAGLLGLLVALFAAKPEMAYYYYDRWSNGVSYQLAGGCYVVPDQWALTEKPTAVGPVQVRLHFVDPPVFTAVRDATTLSAAVASSVKIESQLTGVDVYRFDAPDGDRLYIAQNTVLGLGVTGKSAESVAAFASAIRRCP